MQSIMTRIMSVQFYLCTYCCLLALPVLGWQPVWQVVGVSYRSLMCFPSPHRCFLHWHRSPSSWTWRAYGHSDAIGFPWLGPMRWYRTVFSLGSSPRTQLPHCEEAKEPCGRPLSRLQLQTHVGCSDHIRDHIRDTAGLQGFQPSLWVPTNWWLTLGGNRDKCPCGQMKGHYCLWSGSLWRNRCIPKVMRMCPGALACFICDAEAVSLLQAVNRENISYVTKALGPDLLF